MKFALNRATGAYLISKLLRDAFIEGGQAALSDAFPSFKTMQEKNCLEKLKKNTAVRDTHLGGGTQNPVLYNAPFGNLVPFSFLYLLLKSSFYFC